MPTETSRHGSLARAQHSFSSGEAASPDVRISRRRVAAGAAWAAPAIVLGGAAPAMAASPGCQGYMAHLGNADSFTVDTETFSGARLIRRQKTWYWNKPDHQSVTLTMNSYVTSDQAGPPATSMELLSSALNAPNTGRCGTGYPGASIQFIHPDKSNPYDPKRASAIAYIKTDVAITETTASGALGIQQLMVTAGDLDGQIAPPATVGTYVAPIDNPGNASFYVELMVLRSSATLPVRSYDAGTNSVLYNANDASKTHPPVTVSTGNNPYVDDTTGNLDNNTSNLSNVTIQPVVGTAPTSAQFTYDFYGMGGYAASYVDPGQTSFLIPRFYLDCV